MDGGTRKPQVHQDQGKTHVNAENQGSVDAPASVYKPQCEDSCLGILFYLIRTSVLPSFYTGPKITDRAHVTKANTKANHLLRTTRKALCSHL